MYAFAAHGLFVDPAAAAVQASRIERVFVTDTVPPFRLAGTLAPARVEVLAVAPLFAAEIRRVTLTG